LSKDTKIKTHGKSENPRPTRKKIDIIIFKSFTIPDTRQNPKASLRKQIHLLWQRHSYIAKALIG